MKRYHLFKKLFEKVEKKKDFYHAFSDFLSYSLSELSGRREDYTKLYGYEAGKIYFPEMLSHLREFTEEESLSPMGNDLLGEFYEDKVSHIRQSPFESFPVALAQNKVLEKGTRKDSNLIVIPRCGSGRLFLALSREAERPIPYCGMDTNPLFVKITAVNLLLNGLMGEVICIGREYHFRHGYKILRNPGRAFLAGKPEGLSYWQMIREVILVKNREKKTESKPFSPRSAAKDFILPFVLESNMYELRNSRGIEAKEENYAARTEDGQVVVTDLYGVSIREEFPIKEIVKEIVDDLKREVKGSFRDVVQR